jgi:hypothetical protein
MFPVRLKWPCRFLSCMQIEYTGNADTFCEETGHTKPGEAIRWLIYGLMTIYHCRCYVTFVKIIIMSWTMFQRNCWPHVGKVRIRFTSELRDSNPQNSSQTCENRAACALWSGLSHHLQIHIQQQFYFLQISFQFLFIKMSTLLQNARQHNVTSFAFLHIQQRTRNVNLFLKIKSRHTWEVQVLNFGRRPLSKHRSFH